MFYLICTFPFGSYVAGQVIIDQALIKRLLADGHEDYFVRVPPGPPWPPLGWEFVCGADGDELTAQDGTPILVTI